MSLLLTELRSLTRRRPARLLAIGVSGSESLDADELRVSSGLPDPQSFSDPFNLIVWQLHTTFKESELRTVSSLLAERSRLVLVVRPDQRRETILGLSRQGFAIHDERHLSDGSAQLVIARHTDFLVRSYEEGDEDDILRMFKPSFHVERSMAHWRWKFENQPFGTRQITIARAPDGRLAAHYAGYPMVFARFGENGHNNRHPLPELWTALQIGDTMTLPQFRNVGRGPTSLLGRCVRHYFATHCDGRIDFNFGFNTGNIQKFNRRFVDGAAVIEEVGYWIRPVGSPPVSRTYRIFSPKRLDERWDRFFDRVGPHYGFLVQRNAEWLRWRYRQCPDEPPFLILAARSWGRLVGWGVFRRHGNRMRWCDALFDPRHLKASWPLLKVAMQHPSMAGVESIEAWFPSRPEWWRRQLVALGFEPAKQPDHLALIAAPFRRPDATEALANLYYTMGDGDLA